MGILRKKRTAQHRYVPNCTWNDVPPTVAIQALPAQRPLAGPGGSGPSTPDPPDCPGHSGRCLKQSPRTVGTVFRTES